MKLYKLCKIMQSMYNFFVNKFLLYTTLCRIFENKLSLFLF